MPPLPSKPAPQFSIFEELRRASEALELQARQPNIYRYTPHAKQLEFHCDPHKDRLFVAGNRTGKSLATVIEGIWYLTKTHPYRETPTGQVRGRVVCVDFLNGVDKIILPLYKQWLPEEYLIDGSWEKSYSRERHLLTLRDGSFVEFMSQEQNLDKFAGTSRHFIHFDEECPKIIFDECRARLIDTNGDWWISETPVAGMEWIYDDIFVPAKEGTADIGVIEASMSDNSYLTEEARERFLSTMSAAERAMREHGEYTTITGSMFKTFVDDVDLRQHNFSHVIPQASFTLTDQFRLYLTGDHGFNAPTAWLWVAVDKWGSLIVFDEWYKKETVISDHAAAIHRIDKEHGRTPYLIVGDPAMKQRSGITGDTILDEYSRHGIEIQVDGIPHDKQVGINKMLQYMKLNPKTGMPFLMVTDNCVNTIREIKSAKQNRIINKQVASRKNAPEGQREKDDHTTDALRYLVTLMPDLTPEDFAGQQKEKFDFVADMLGAVRPWNGIAERRRAAFDASGWKSPHSETAGLE